MSTGARLQRAYDEPGPDDGYRVLVDRVWRTSDAARCWGRHPFAHSLSRNCAFGRPRGRRDPARWVEFETRYRLEPADPGRARPSAGSRNACAWLR